MIKHLHGVNDDLTKKEARTYREIHSYLAVRNLESKLSGI